LLNIGPTGSVLYLTDMLNRTFLLKTADNHAQTCAIHWNKKQTTLSRVRIIKKTLYFNVIN